MASNTKKTRSKRRSKKNRIGELRRKKIKKSGNIKSYKKLFEHIDIEL
jgi:hypothetical protein